MADEAIPDYSPQEGTEWFSSEISSIPGDMRSLLESYSGLSSSEIIPHIRRIRDAGFKLGAYPCIGQLRFLDLNIAQHPYYPTLQLRLQAGQTLLDTGCCFGQDIRKLVFDGAPDPCKLHGLDLQPAFFSLGYSLFRDKSTLSSQFHAMNLLAPASVTKMEKLDNKVDIIAAFSLLHLFLLPDQITIAKRMVALSNPVPGSVILGRQLSTSAAEGHKMVTKDMVVYAHNLKSFSKMWEDVGNVTGTGWVLDVVERPVGENMRGLSWAWPEMCWMYFRVTRL